MKGYPKYKGGPLPPIQWPQARWRVSCVPQGACLLMRWEWYWAISYTEVWVVASDRQVMYWAPDKKTAVALKCLSTHSAVGQSFTIRHCKCRSSAPLMWSRHISASVTKQVCCKCSCQGGMSTELSVWLADMYRKRSVFNAISDLTVSFTQFEHRLCKNECETVHHEDSLSRSSCRLLEHRTKICQDLINILYWH